MFREILKGNWLTERGAEAAMIIILCVFVGVVIYLLTRRGSDAQRHAREAISDGTPVRSTKPKEDNRAY